MLLPVEGAARTWKARHTRHVAERLGDARRTLQIAWRYYDALEAIGTRLRRATLSAAAFERFLTRLVPAPTGEKASAARVRNADRVRETLRNVYLTTPDLDAIRGTNWGARQAVTAYCDHHARNPPQRRPRRVRSSFERAIEPSQPIDRTLALLSA